jgi:NarL family two-component system sensor histidine kinase LiaS
MLLNVAQNQTIVAAVPILSTDERVLGVLVYSTTMATIWKAIISQVLPLLVGSVFVVTVLVGSLGMIFGLLTSRGLVRRLQTVAKAADTWSEGNFSTMISDRSNDELSRLAIRLNQLAEQPQMLMKTRQELASMEERNRLARDLHDSVKQQVFAAAMQVGAARELPHARTQEAEAHLGEAQRLTQLAQQELTILIRELRPAALEGHGLTAALRDYLSSWSQQSGIEAELRVQGERVLPLDLEQALYRVAQEALSNIVRHSGASLVDVHLAWYRHHLIFTVTDNGHGFKPGSNVHRGLGLDTMKEQAEALGGSLKLESSKDGTKVEFTCPL